MINLKTRTQSDRNSFEAIPNTLDFRHVAIADIHGCGVKEDGRVWQAGGTTRHDNSVGVKLPTKCSILGRSTFQV